jgi:hypothetical protein
MIGSMIAGLLCWQTADLLHLWSHKRSIATEGARILATVCASAVLETCAAHARVAAC